MEVVTFQGIVEQGRIRLQDDVRQPEKALVYVVVPGVESAGPRKRICSPRLVHPEQAADFVTTVEEIPDVAV